MINPFEILGVHRRSTDAEIQTAFHQLAKKHHPDVSKNSEDFTKITTAYSLIKTPIKRRQFIDKAVGVKACMACGGVGAVAKNKGITSVAYSACKTCGGAGLMLK